MDTTSTTQKSMSKRKAQTWATYLILISGIFFLTSVRDGHDWGGDYAQYILHAQALVDGKPYAPPLGYIPNAYLSWSTPAYPVAYPLAIAVVLAVAGLNFIMLKIQVVLFFSFGLIAYWKLARHILPAKAALGALAFIAFCPYFLKFSNKVISDIPFLTISLFSIIIAHNFFRSAPSRTHTGLLIASLVLALCFRTAGMPLVFAVPLYALFFKRTHLLASIVVSTVTLGFLALLSWQLVGFYLAQTGPGPERLLLWFWGNLQSFPYHTMRILSVYPQLDLVWANRLNYTLSNTFLILCGIGAFYRIWHKKIEYWDVYTALYLCMVLAYSLLRARYLLPVMPLLVFYFIGGLRVLFANILRYSKTLARRHKLRAFRFAFPTLIYLPLFFAYWTHYALKPATPEANILKAPEVQDLFNEVRSPRHNITGAIFDRPRVLSLFTGVRATTCFNATRYWQQDIIWDLDKLAHLAQQGNISHLILDHKHSAMWHALSPIVDKHPQYFHRVYSNTGYDIYHMQFPAQLTSGG